MTDILEADGSESIGFAKLLSWLLPEKDTVAAFALVEKTPIRLSNPHLQIITTRRGVKVAVQPSKPYGYSGTVLSVNQALFETDVNHAAFAEVFSWPLLFEYVAVKGESYVRDMARRLRQRIIVQELAALVHEYGRVTSSLLIQPVYALLAPIHRRALLYTRLRPFYSAIVQDGALRSRLLAQYGKALQTLVERGVILERGDSFKISGRFVEESLKRRKIASLFDLADVGRRIILGPVLDAIKKPTIDSVFRTSYLTDKNFPAYRNEVLADPKGYLFLEARDSLIRVDNASSIREVIEELHAGSIIQVEPLGSFLSQTYRVSFDSQKLVAKHYDDWSSLKWVTLAILATGTPDFTISGRSRMENEYSMSRFLSSQGVPVPEIVHISLRRRLIIESFVEGDSAIQIFRAYFSGGESREGTLKIVENVGEALGLIHSLGTAIGDTKPDNIIQGQSGKMFFVDLEQAKAKGDFAWDLAELAFYSCRFCVNSNELASFLTALIHGYLRTGKKGVPENAGKLRYARLFSLWVRPDVLYSAAKILRNA